MSAIQEIALTVAVSLSPIWLACVIGAVCWGIRFNKGRKGGRR